MGRAQARLLTERLGGRLRDRSASTVGVKVVVTEKVLDNDMFSGAEVPARRSSSPQNQNSMDRTAVTRDDGRGRDQPIPFRNSES